MRTDSLRWIVLGLLCLSTVINYVDRQALAVVLPSLRSSLGITSVQYGTISTVFLIAYTVSQVPSGMMIDRLGSRLGFLLSIALWSIAAALHALAAGPWSLGVLRFFLGIGEAGNWPAGGKAVAEWFPQQRRAFAMAVFDGGSAAGAILAPPVVAGLALLFGWRAAFVATGLTGFVWMAAWWWIYRKPSEHPWLNETARQDAVRDERAGSAAARIPLAVLLRERKLWGLMLTRMVATPVWWFYVFWLPDYFAKDRGFGLKEIALFGWIPYLTVDIGKLLGGGLSDHLLEKGFTATIARKSVMAFGALAMMGGIRVAAAETSWAAIAWVSLATFGFGMWSANILALHTDVFPKGAMATAIGWTGTAASLGGALFTYITGWVVDSKGYAPVFWTVGSLAMFAFVALVFVLGRVEPVRLPSEATA